MSTRNDQYSNARARTMARKTAGRFPVKGSAAVKVIAPTKSVKESKFENVEKLPFYNRPSIWYRIESGIEINGTIVTDDMLTIVDIIARKGGVSVWADNTSVNEVYAIIELVAKFHGMRVTATMDSQLWAVDFRI